MTDTVLMIHGVGSSADAFVKLAPAFRERGWKVETPTLKAKLRPTENPPPELAQVSLSDYVDEVAGIAKRIARETGAPPVVLGHSMGGLLTQKLAEAGLARAAILVTPASPPDARAGRALSQGVTFANILFTGRPEARAHKIWKFGFRWGVLNCVPKERHEEVWQGRRYDSGRVYADLAYPEEDPNRTAFVDETHITAPMLIIGAAQDRATPVADVRLCAKKYASAGADYLEYPDHAHWIVDEPGSERVFADIFAWLDRKGVRPGAAKPKKAAAKKPAAKKTAAKPAKAAPKKAARPKAAPKRGN